MTMQTVQISHDAFAREALTREVVRTQATCSWCGNNHHGRLFRYYVEPDRVQSQQNAIKGLFCSVNCMRTYNL